MNIGFLLLTLVCSYLLGSFPSAYFITKRVRGLDIRSVGSGNVGSTNAVRILGLPLGALVFVTDVLKGLIPALLGKWLGGESVAILAGLCSLIGHIFPVWLEFKGGKGVATALGVALALFPVLGLTAFATWVITLFLTDRVAVASVAAAAALGAMVLVNIPLLPYKIGFTIIALLVIWKHRSNFLTLKK
ncbi:MAG: glycerol-3-phosphate 1-O-acyltransferase PlsY [Firmicutes bacterium]|nr:glycerol-3-phosphate 1-O-acyltransferase PlsY [Bacillota bacterium]